MPAAPGSKNVLAADDTGGNRRGRRITLWVGLVLLVAGFGLLLWLAWSVWGTNWVSQREERREVTQFVHHAGGPATLLEIPRFGANYVVPINDGVSTDILSKGVGHFTGTGPGASGEPSTIEPGQIGNYALAAHRITHGQPFARLPELRPGDKIYVITHHMTYVYVLDTNPNDLVVPFTAAWVLHMEPTNPSRGPQAVSGPQARVITLLTCSELFHTDNRMVAFGHLQTSYPTNPADPTNLTRSP